MSPESQARPAPGQEGQPSSGTDLLDILESLAFALVAITSRAIEDAAPHGELTFQQWRVLVVLGIAPEGMRVTDLAVRIAASGPSTSRIARRLERRGLLVSSADPADGRAVRLSLSHAGRRLRARIVDRRRSLLDASIVGSRVSAGSSAELQALIEPLARWV